MMTALIGIALALVIGVACRWLDIPVPAPPRLQGALLVVAMTAGFIVADRFSADGRPQTKKGATGAPFPSSCRAITASAAGRTPAPLRRCRARC